MKKAPLESPQRMYDTTVISVGPGITAGLLEHCTAVAKAVILVTYASGTTPGCLNPVIRARVLAGVPVFLVANNPKNDNGIINSRRYATQVSALEAGAIPIEKVNVNRIEDVLSAIQDGLDAGQTGMELGETVRVKFAYGPGEKVPLAEWETPEGLAALATRREEMERGIADIQKAR
ncbi:MAG: hypothetical protein V1908_01220 [Candidatus Peregrinibacteria bacterium]